MESTEAEFSQSCQNVSNLGNHCPEMQVIAKKKKKKKETTRNPCTEKNF